MTGLDLTLGLPHYRLLLVGLTFLAMVHAHTKVSPYFALTWLGSTLLFGWFWAGGRGDPELVLLPCVVVYTAAAVTKGLLETRGMAGIHSLHVVFTGLLSGLLALPILALARAMGWPVPRPVGRVLLGVEPEYLGGITLDAVAQWVAIGFLVYGVYKVLDHVGLPRWLAVLVLFASMPFVAEGAAWLHGLV